MMGVEYAVGLTELLMRGGGYAVAAIFISLYLLERRRASLERAHNIQLQERTAALAIDVNRTMGGVQAAISSLKELLERAL